jgi:hypothetical protein
MRAGRFGGTGCGFRAALITGRSDRSMRASVHDPPSQSSKTCPGRANHATLDVATPRWTTLGCHDDDRRGRWLP